jgi:CheY-like chemotaxis protein
MEKLKDLSCILLIDDEEINNYLNTRLIEKLNIGVHVESVFNGREALEYLTCTEKYSDNKIYPQPGLIFLDINMPGMNGWEFLAEYSKLPDEKKGKIVIAMLTASINPDDEKKAQGYKDLDGFLNKPLTLGALEGLINKYFE